MVNGPARRGGGGFETPPGGSRVPGGVGESTPPTPRPHPSDKTPAPAPGGGKRGVPGGRFARGAAEWSGGKKDRPPEAFGRPAASWSPRPCGPSDPPGPAEPSGDQERLQTPAGRLQEDLVVAPPPTPTIR